MHDNNETHISFLDGKEGQKEMEECAIEHKAIAVNGNGKEGLQQDGYFEKYEKKLWFH